MIVRAAASGWLLIFRLYAGFFWLAHGLPKFLNPQTFMPPNGFMPQMVARAAGSSTGFYHDFLVNTVIPNIALFAELDRFGEVLTGVSLILGLLTPLGGITGCFLALNYMAAKGEFGHGQGYVSLDAAAFVLSFFCLVLGLGRIAGLDAILFGRRRRPPTPEFVADVPAGPHAPAD